MSMNTEVTDRVVRELEESAPSEAQLAQDRDPDRDDFIDEKSAAVLEAQEKKAAEEGSFDYAGIWDSLSEEERIALLNSGEIGRADVIRPQSARFIDLKAASPRYHYRWISIDRRLGQWGYRPVLRTPDTMAWVPNMPRHGSAKYFIDRGQILCAIPKAEWLKRVAAQHHATNTTAFEKYNSAFETAHNKLAEKFGITEQQQSRMSRGRDGFALKKGPDPHGGRDMVSADEIEREREEGARPSNTQRMGRRSRR